MEDLRIGFEPFVDDGARRFIVDGVDLYGTRLLSDAHDYARARGAVGATLETYSFQARPFYERLGYELCGTIDGYPPGHAKFFLRKSPL